MGKRTTVVGLRGLLALGLLTVGCSESTDPERRRVGAPEFQTAASGITLDQANGALRQEASSALLKGFNPTNPHLGDAIVATFFWLSSNPENIITEVHDHLANSDLTPVGNTYTLVEFVHADGVSMATYVATDVQNYPDPCCAADQQENILVVQADLSEEVNDGGIKISAWTGVDAAQALDRRSSASGSGSSETIAAPGAIAVDAGMLVYAVTMANDVVPFGRPAGFTQIGEGSNDFIKEDGEYLVAASASSVNPEWTWFFDKPSTWLATALALSPASPPLGSLTVRTSTTGSSLDPNGYTVTVDGAQSQPIATNDPTGVTFTDLEAGSHSVVLSGVATNCSVSGGNSRMVTVVAGETVTTTFSVSCTTPTTSVNDFMTGGGKLQDGREFVTFGFVARPTGGDFEWVQHCPNGVNPASAACKAGQFTFHGSVTPGTYAGRDGFPKCRTWSGTGSTKSGTQRFTVNMKCDNGEPGRSVDFIDVNIDINGYHSAGYLTGGNLQLHKSRS